MNINYKANVDAGDFAAYLQSMVTLDQLEKITQDLDNELLDTQHVMKDIQSIFKAIPKREVVNTEASNDGLRHEDLSNFLEADMPKILMPDMPDNVMDIDLDDTIAKMKDYLQDLKNNITVTAGPTQNSYNKLEGIDLEPYATSLGNLSKRLANIKLSKREELNQKNEDLENKMMQLCEDVNMFTQMVQAKTTLSKCNENWSQSDQNGSALHYDTIINKLLAEINEVHYLLQNNKC